MINPLTQPDPIEELDGRVRALEHITAALALVLTDEQREKLKQILDSRPEAQ